MNSKEEGKRKLFMPSDEQPQIGIYGQVVYCNNATKSMNHKVCEKCLLHGFHVLTGITLICKSKEDWEDEWKDYIEELKSGKDES